MLGCNTKQLGAALVRPQHLDLVALPFNDIAGDWNPLEAVRDEAADRRRLDLRIPRDTQLCAQLAQIDPRTNDQRTVSEFVEFVDRQVALVEDLADDFLDDLEAVTGEVAPARKTTRRKMSPSEPGRRTTPPPAADRGSRAGADFCDPASAARTQAAIGPGWNRPRIATNIMTRVNQQ